MDTFLRFVLLFFVALVANFSVTTPIVEPKESFIPQETLGKKSTEITQEKEVAPNSQISETEKNLEIPTTLSKEAPEKQDTVTTTIVLPKKNIVDFEAINTKTRESLVNIICFAKGGGISPITGSGVFVSEKGVILTNAHVGQYFLLDNFIDCFIRTGSPAVAKYRASLLYISKRWLTENSKSIVTENPKGTGENDYALLLVSGVVSNSPLPSVFPSLEMELATEPQKGETVLIAGYAAGFLGGLTIENSLSILSTINSIANIFTFKETTTDLLSINGSIISQKGSSGGAVVNQEGKLSGIIATATQESETDKRELRAITTTHINRSFSEESGESLQLFFSQNLLVKTGVFRDSEFPSLQKILLDEIAKKAGN